jgi:L-alanine-DL-glutamate epimerase-like enolase superfamily enzyme
LIGLRTQAFDLPLKHVFTISRGSVSVQQTLIVQLAAEGRFGYGEATVNDYYGATIENMTAAVERVRPLLERADISDLEQTLAEAGKAIGGLDKHGASFALCAVDMALHDLWGKQQGASLGALWGLDREAGPQSNFTIGIDTIPKMVEKLLEESDWPIYKIKLGASEDIAIVQELRKHTAAPFRVDANCGWSPTEAVRLSHELKELGVEFIEQPLPSDNPEAMRQVVQDSALPLFADESCVSEADIDRCQGLFHGVNIKLVKCGGLAPARRMIARAKELGLLVMMGCMTESTVGISAIAQLLPLLDHVDMDGAALLAKDIASGARVVNGRCLLPSENGSGVALLAGPLE